MITDCNKNCYCISKVSSNKYLGVIFDELLKCKLYMLIIRLWKCFYIVSKELHNIVS